MILIFFPWKFDKDDKKIPGYPSWNGYFGLPYGPDAALNMNGELAVFKEGYFWVLDEKNMDVKEGYPKAIKFIWPELEGKRISAAFHEYDRFAT